MAARFPALHMISHGAPSSSYSAHNDYLITVHWQGHPTGLHQSALLYVVLRDVLRTGHYRPTQLEKDRLLSERFTRDLAGVFHRRGWPRRLRPQANAGFSFHPASPHNSFNVVAFLTAFLLSQAFVYVRYHTPNA